MRETVHKKGMRGPAGGRITGDAAWPVRRTGRVPVGWLIPLLLAAVLMGANRQLGGQITSAAADFRDSLDLPVSGGKLPLFAFHQTNGVNRPGSLSARHPSGGNFTFAWSRFNPATMAYDIPLKTDDDLPASGIQDLESGGYQVQITGTGVDTLMQAWVWLDRMHAKVTKNSQGNLHPEAAKELLRAELAPLDDGTDPDEKHQE